ncbi:MAG: TetR/AcrR family transcriptional regulator [bacterium]|nr:TetR/AcrR family transcriptional regulator [bacterium]
MNIKHDKEKVIQIGLNLFCSKGYGNVGLDEICTETGMTKGAFYNAFESKENFLLITLGSFDKSNTERITKVLTPNHKVKAIDQLQDFYNVMLKMQPKMNYMGCMVNNMMSELGAINEKVADATCKGFEKIIGAVEPCVKRAQKEGDINPDYDSKEMAALLHATFYGVLTRSKSLGSNKKGFKTMELLFNNLKQK